MNILLTNDDGIDSQGLYAIYKELKKIGKVTIVAPDKERSAISQAITLSEPIFSKKIHKNGKFYGTAISGTPADCIKFALEVVLKGKKPDIIISGINLGPNDGCSVFYSGTVAGAREGALFGIPSISLSLATFSDPYFDYTAKTGVRFVKFIKAKGLPRNCFLNINVPNAKSKDIKGIKVTKQGVLPIHSNFKKHKDPNGREYYWLSGRNPINKKDPSVDIYALNEGYITITPIKTDTTDYEYIRVLSEHKIK